MALALVATACVSYTGVSKSPDGELYISGGTNYFVYSTPWVRRCTVDATELKCVELSESPKPAAGSNGGTAAPAPSGEPSTATAPERSRDRMTIARRAEPFDRDGWPMFTEAAAADTASRPRRRLWPAVAAAMFGTAVVGLAVGCLPQLSGRTGPVVDLAHDCSHHPGSVGSLCVKRTGSPPTGKSRRWG